MAHRRTILAIAVFMSGAVSALGLGAGALLYRRAAGAPSSPDMGGMMRMMGGGMGTATTQTVRPEDADALGRGTPAGAAVDTTHNQLTFTTMTVSFSVLGSPDTGPDMRFRVAGLVDPTIVVPQGASVTVQFINADRDISHGWQLSSTQPPYPTMALMTASLAFPGAFVLPISRATKAAMPSETVSFMAATAVQYVYLCPVMGHARAGMHGEFVVTPS